MEVSEVFNRVRSHAFHPLDKKNNSYTYDKNLNLMGIADINDADWKVRLLAVRDLVRAGVEDTNEIIAGLSDSTSLHVRYVSAMALGILKERSAIIPLEKMLREEKNAAVRSQAVISLGQILSKQSLDLLKDKQKSEPSRDVRHQCELAIDQIEKGIGATNEQLEAFINLNEDEFEIAKEGEKALDFSLSDTDGNIWKLGDFVGKKPVVLIWVFADWCPVCHGEFHDLIEIYEEFEKEGVEVVTIECHDTYRGRVMVGKELEPEYWFSEKSFKEEYTNSIKWPHLLDRAGAVGAKYGAAPLTFAVHAEYINRPTTVIIDKEGIIRLLYKGTYWGDRPTIEQTLEMIKENKYDFEHPKRLKQ
jgi:peroxiredoxin